MLFPSIVFQKQQDIYPDRSDWSIFIINISLGLGDFLGRTLAKLKETYSRRFMGIQLILRLTFVATTFLIALSDSPFWNHPAVVIANATLIGLTNGICGGGTCNTIPTRLKNNEKEFGGFVISVMINGGITAGSLLSWAAFSGLFNK
jgi:hypothetical protein